VVVTANKALVAKHGLRLAKLPEARRRLNFEAAVGAHSRDQDLREGLSGTASIASTASSRHLQLHPDPDGAGGLSFADA